jgi:FtsZ-binding cell division protein ZapB
MNDYIQNNIDTIRWYRATIESLKEINKNLVDANIQLRVDMKSMQEKHDELTDMTRRKAGENCESTIQNYKLGASNIIMSIYQEHKQVVKGLELSLKESQEQANELQEHVNRGRDDNSTMIKFREQLYKEKDNVNLYKKGRIVLLDKLKKANHEKKLLEKKAEQQQESHKQRKKWKSGRRKH